MIKYELHVKDLEIKGHPFAEYNSDLNVASKRFDELVEKYPNYDVLLFETERKLLKCNKGIEIIPKTCPKGHIGTIDGKNILTRTGSNGIWMCSICGDIFYASK